MPRPRTNTSSTFAPPHTAARVRLTLFTLALCVGSFGCGSELAAPVVERAETKPVASVVEVDESYVVMGQKSVVVRQGTHVASGHIGASLDVSAWPVAGDDCVQKKNNGSPDIRRCFVSQDGSSLRFERNVDAAAATKVFGNVVTLDSGARVRSVQYKDSLHRHATAVVASDAKQMGAADFPTFKYPTPKSVDASGDDTGASGAPELRINKDETRCLEPGTYGDIRLGERATLRFAASCATPDAPTHGSYVVRDLHMGASAVLRVGPGDARLRDLDTGTESHVSFGGGTVRLRDLSAAPRTKLALAPAAYHFRNLRTFAHVTTQLTKPDGAVNLMVANKLRLGRGQMFNATRVDSNLPSEVAGSLIRLYVHGRDGDTELDGTPEPESEQVYPSRSVAAEVGYGTKIHADILALGTGGEVGGTIHLRQGSIAIGSYFADHVIVDSQVELSNRAGLVGAAGPAYVDGDADRDGIADELDNCLTMSNRDQADRDRDGAGDACDNCPTVSNPQQEVAFPGDQDNRAGAACQVPALPYCGDGVVQTARGEACDLGPDAAKTAANAASTRSCSPDCLHRR